MTTRKADIETKILAGGYTGNDIIGDITVHEVMMEMLADYILGDVGTVIDASKYSPNTLTKTTIDNALADIGTSDKVTLLLRPGTWVIAANADWSSYTNVTFWIPPGTLLSHGAYTIAMANAPRADKTRIFSGTGQETFTFAREVPVEWWGLATGTTTAIQTLNSTAIQQAIDCNASIITFPNGSFSYNTALLVDRGAVRIDGAGASAGISAQGILGVGTTLLTYTGTGIALTVTGDAANGMENVHLSNFSLLGTAAAAGGLLLGNTTTYITKSSFRNLTIRSFGKTNAYGLSLNRVLESSFDNLHVLGNYDGIIQPTGQTCTSLEMRNIYTGGNTRYGMYLSGTIYGSSFYDNVFESNGDIGLYILSDTAETLAFYSCYAEANNVSAGVSQLQISSGAHDISFYNWRDSDDPAGTRTHEIYLNTCDRIQFFYPSLQSTSYIKVGALTTKSELYTSKNLTSVYNNALGQMRIHGIKTSNLTPDDTAPSIGDHVLNYLQANTQATTITDFVDGFAGQTFAITFTYPTADTHIADGGNFQLAAGTAFSAVAYQASGIYPTIAFVNVASVWHETSRTHLT